MMAMQNSRISYFGNIARLKKAIHTHHESDPLWRVLLTELLLVNSFYFRITYLFKSVKSF